MSQCFALVDCNNFYASCEKLFRPDLKDVPVVVLSNNDGCIVARSKEAKALGYKMGQPYFQVKDDLIRNGVTVFSSNYALYADISNRVMSVLHELAPQVELYSIDESFLDVAGIHDLVGFGHQIRNTVGQWTGISVCVGMAQSKTLAKLANHAAKQYPATGGVVDLTDPARQKRLMKLVEVGDVWGVGRRISKRLNALGIRTALELAQADPKQMRRHFSVVLERTIAELNGESCLELEEIAPPQKQIVSSRSFGSRVTELAQMREAVCLYMTRAAEKLRAGGQVARHATVFIHTSGYAENEPQYSNAASSSLVIPTADTRELVATAMRLLESIWCDGYRYAKAGVMLSELCAEQTQQADLFADNKASEKGQRLMAVIDQINNSGKGRVFLASQGVRRDWDMQRRFMSPCYTTRWDDLPKVY